MSNECPPRHHRQAAADFFKSKLPDPIAGQIDGILSGKGAEADSAMAKIGSAFNR
jgi:hypothetical protein